MSELHTTQAEPTLQRQLSFRDLIGYGLAYIAPIAPLSTIGFVWDSSNGLIALAYLFGGLCMLFTANSYAVMTREIRTAGSVYGFARQILGNQVGFVAGWIILLDYLLIPAVVYVLIAVALSQLIPGVDRSIWILLLVATTFGINWFGIKTTSRVNMASVVAQIVVVVALLVMAGFALARGEGSGGFGTAPFFTMDAFSPTAIFAATSICVMSFLGFDAVSTLSEEARDPTGRSVGRAIITVLVMSTGFFVLTAWLLGNLMQNFTVKDPAAAIYELSAARIAPWTAVVIAWVYAIIVGFTNALPMQAGVARVLFAMARDKTLPAALAKVHPRHRTPWVAMGLSSVLSCVVALLMRDSLDELASLVNFGALLGFFVLHLCVIVHFGVRQRSQNWLAHWVMPIFGMIVILAVLTGMSLLAVYLGLAWTVAGIVYCLVQQRRQRPSTVEAQLS